MTITTTREFDCDGSRYFYDCNLPRHYAQLLTSEDASYYGNWASPINRRLISYAEGDIVTTCCTSDQEFKEELLAFAAFCKRAGLHFYGIDPGVSPPEELLELWRSHQLNDLLRL